MTWLFLVVAVLAVLVIAVASMRRASRSGWWSRLGGGDTEVCPRCEGNGFVTAGDGPRPCGRCGGGGWEGGQNAVS